MQPQPPLVSMDALNALYRDVGEARHAVYERNAEILALRRELAALKAKYEPAGDAGGKGAERGVDSLEP